MSKIIEHLREYVKKCNINKLKNTDFSLISSNCNGAIILHDLNLRFLSPTVNLWMKPDDFLKYLKNLPQYINSDLVFSEEETELGYPVGILGGDIRIYFQHYDSREEAKGKWLERSKRINLDNLFIIFTDRDGCTYQQMKEFDELTYENKVIFTNKKYPDIKSAFYIKGFENMESVGMCYEYRSKISWKRYYDDFPYVQWFNGTFKNC